VSNVPANRGSQPHNEGVNHAELTEAEQSLWNAFGRGAWVDLGGAGTGGAGPGGTEIRGEVIAALLLGAVPAEPGTAAGVRLRGANITGRLDLLSGSVGWPLVIEDCRFEAELGLVDSSLRTVCILRSELPAFNGTRLRLDGILDLTGSTIAGCVRLDHAKVAGQLRLREVRAGTEAAAATATEAVAATGLSVDGNVDCTLLEAHGRVTFNEATVGGAFDLSQARISRPGQRALTLNYATIGGKLECHRLTVEGETRAHNCRVAGQLGMSAARLESTSGTAFFAGGLRLGGGAFFTSGFRAHGEFRLIGAQLGANLTIEGATFDNPGGIAVNLEHASIGSVQGDDLTCKGQLSLIGAHVSGNVDLARAVLEAGAGSAALNAQRAQIDGSLVLRGARALGQVNLRSLRLGERLLLQRAELRNPAGVACRLTRAQVTADIFCNRLTADGQLRLVGTVVGGTIELTDARLANPGDLALAAGNLRVQELVLRPAAPVEGVVDLSDATIGVLRDDPASWPDRLLLDGLTYETLDPLLPASQRLRWLRADSDGGPQPYEQLASHYNAIGQPAQGRDVLYARERAQHQERNPAARAWSALQDITVGYGYRPRRALGWLALLLVVGSVVFSVAPPPALQSGTAPHFNGIIYTLDLMLPVVNFGQKYAFNPGGAEQWLSYLFIAAGWVLATTVATGAARILRRG
jgi:hypothetical protein